MKYIIILIAGLILSSCLQQSTEENNDVNNEKINNRIIEEQIDSSKILYVLTVVKTNSLKAKHYTCNSMSTVDSIKKNITKDNPYWTFYITEIVNGKNYKFLAIDNIIDENNDPWDMVNGKKSHSTYSKTIFYTPNDILGHNCDCIDEYLAIDLRFR
jgi:hypothetical protein